MLSALRRSAFLVRLVLGWFVLSLGVAAASPLVQPQTIDWVCTGSSIKAVVLTDDGAVELGAQHLDCPLCLSLLAPPPTVVPLAEPLRVSAALDARLALPAVPWVFSTPWHARGPPVIA